MSLHLSLLHLCYRERDNQTTSRIGTVAIFITRCLVLLRKNAAKIGRVSGSVFFMLSSPFLLSSLNQMSYGCEASLAPPLIYPQCFGSRDSVEPGGLRTASQEFLTTLIRLAKLHHIYCSSIYSTANLSELKSSSEARKGLFLLIEMVGIEHMARPRIWIKGYV